MFLGTYREAEVGEDHPLPELIASLRREEMLTQVPLEGLAHGETAELVATGGDGTADFVAALQRQTEGNPLFVEEEIVRHGGELEDAGVPEGVREVTARRIARLPGSSREAMQVACVIGREFDFGLLEALGPADRRRAGVGARRGGRGGVLKEDDERVGRYAFVHALVRATLYDGLSSLRRARLHSRVGDHPRPPPGRHRPVAAAARAPLLPGGAGRGPGARDRLRARRGRRADRLLAWEEAAGTTAAALRARQATSVAATAPAASLARARRL